MIQKIIFSLRGLMAGLLMTGASVGAQDVPQALVGRLMDPVVPEQHRHEISVYGGGGLSTLHYSTGIGSQKEGFGGHFGLGYHFFFSPKWALGTGVEFARYNARFSVDNLLTRYPAIDPEGASFEFRSTLNNYRERQHAGVIQVPLMLYHQSKGLHKWYAAAGIKAGFPLAGSYSSTNGGVDNSGYYEYEDYEYTTQTFMGFGHFDGKEGKGDLLPRFQGTENIELFASLELGRKWNLNASWSLYAGLYMDYGLNSIGEDPQIAQPFVAYSAASPGDFTVNSALNSQHTPSSGVMQTFTDRVIPIAAGIKVRLAFGKTCSEKSKAGASQQPVTDIPADKVDDATKAAEEAKKAAADEAARKAADDAAAARAAAEEAAKKAADDAAKAAADAAKAADDARKAAEAATKPATDGKQSPPDEKSPDEATQRIADSDAAAADTMLLKPVDGYIVSHTDLNADRRQRWDANIAVLQKYPDMKVFIYGHTCDLGNPQVNERIGKQRAETVKAYLISKGIAPERILGTASKRDTEPVVANDTEQHRRMNRSVELIPQQ